MSIVIVGGDGYLGWPLAMKVARKFPTREIVLVDNFSRRRLVREVGSHSLIPNPPLVERIEAFSTLFGLNNLRFQEIDITTSALGDILRDVRPSLIYHLGQQASAGYSMSGLEEALYTLQNNETGNLRLLWGMRDYTPNAHLIKLGSFGEYAKSTIPIAEGYFYPEYKGQQAEVAMPYPRASDDIYHITKINDSNFLAMACKKWGLHITEIMQSTVVGTTTRELENHPELATRFNYDSFFGTVLNRFLVQVLAGKPLTVYGSGHQRTGLMSLEDSLDSLVSMAEQPPAACEHRVINHVTERRYSINELATRVQQVTQTMGYHVEIQRGVYDPREERPLAKLAYTIESAYVDEHIEKTPLEEVIRVSMNQLAPHRSSIRPSLFPPLVQWKASSPPKQQEALSQEQDIVLR